MSVRRQIPRPRALARLATLGLTALLCTVCLPAQSTSTKTLRKDKHGVTMDDLSRATLERWEKMEYHAGRTGLQTVSFTIRAESEGPLGKAKAEGKYSFTEKKTSLKWDNADLGRMLEQRGFNTRMFARLFRDSHRASLKDTTLAAEKHADGSTTIRVEGKTDGGYKSFHYDPDGVATHFTVAVDSPLAGGKAATIRLRYEKKRRFYVRTGWSYELETKAGKLVGDVAVENTRIGKHYVYSKVVESLKLADKGMGKSVLTFLDYKVNGVSGGPRSPPKDAKKAAPTSKPPAPTSRPSTPPPPKSQRRVDAGKI